MPTNNRNLLSREAYLKGITHPRKKELATMLLDRASIEEMNEAGFARLNVLEAAGLIRMNVEGEEQFRIAVPRGTAMDSSSPEDVARNAAEEEAAKKGSPTVPPQDGSSLASVPAQPVGDSASDIIPNETHVMIDETTAPDGKEVPGVVTGEETANPVETVGGNEVGTLTGEEDAETLQRKADEEAAANAGDAA